MTVKNESELKKWEKLLGGKRIGNSNTLRLQKIGKVSEMPGYKEGAWWIQNFSASLPVFLLGNIENLQVIDCCAAPGGKTMQLVSGGARTTSIDRSKRRVETLKQNLERTKLNSKIIISDVLDFTPEIPYDVVLLDAPCSSTGTLRKNPEIEYLDPISRIKTFSEVQKRLLNHVSNWVKPGGRKDVPGRPIQYVTTDDFLSHFNLQKLSDLPTVDELGTAGLIDTSNVDASIFGTGKFFKEKQEDKKENIYSEIDEMLSGTLKNDDDE